MCVCVARTRCLARYACLDVGRAGRPPHADVNTFFNGPFFEWWDIQNGAYKGIEAALQHIKRINAKHGGCSVPQAARLKQLGGARVRAHGCVAQPTPWCALARSCRCLHAAVGKRLLAPLLPTTREGHKVQLAPRPAGFSRLSPNSVHGLSCRPV